MNAYTNTNKTLTENQARELEEFFQIDNARGHTEVLLTIYHGYLAAANQNGTTAGELSNSFHYLTKAIKLIQAMEETPALEIKKPLPVHQN